MVKSPDAAKLSMGFNPNDNKPKMVSMGGPPTMFLGLSGPMGGSTSYEPSL